MNTKSLIALAAVLVILVLVYVSMPNKAAQTNRAESRFKSGDPVFPELKSDFVSSVRIAVKDKAMEIAKRDGSWMVQDGEHEKPASQDRLNDLLKTLSELKIDSVASNRRENHEIYEVVDATATRLTIKDQGGKQVGDLLIGKQQGYTQSIFVRYPDADEVLTVAKNLNYDLMVYPPERELRPDNWVEKKIWDIPRDQINEITLTDATGTVVLKRRDETSEWLVVSPQTFDADTTKVDRILGTLSQPYASELLIGTTPEITGLDNPAGTVVVSVTPSGTHTLLIGNQVEYNRYALDPSNDKYIYKVPDYSFYTNLFKPVDDWRRPTPTPTPEGGNQAETDSGEVGPPAPVSMGEDSIEGTTVEAFFTSDEAMSADDVPHATPFAAELIPATGESADVEAETINGEVPAPDATPDNPPPADY